jgi:hypothetical protein
MAWIVPSPALLAAYSKRSPAKERRAILNLRSVFQQAAEK